MRGMILALCIIAALLSLVLCCASFVLGVLTSYPARQRQRRAIVLLTRQLSARVERQPPPYTVTLSQGVSLQVLLSRPPLAALAEQSVEHWREHSQPEDDSEPVM